MPQVNLLEFPHKEWQKKFDILLQDPYIQKKYIRSKRLQDKFEYVDRYLDDIVRRKGNVLDIGPGPGEFMEACRYFGCHPTGIDAAEGESQMGDPYWELSKLMVERQRLDVLYEGVEHMMNKGGFPFQSVTFDIINAQGSIEMVFRNYMTGPEFSTHMKAKNMSWVVNEKLDKMMLKFMSECHRILTTGGVLLIHANGCSDISVYDDLITKAVEQVEGFEIAARFFDRTMHRMRKL